MAGKRLFAAISLLVLAVLGPGALPAQELLPIEELPLELLAPASDPVESAWANGGAIVGWGQNTSGQLNVPAGVKSVVAVAGGAFHSLALKADGTVVGWGLNANGQCDAPPGLANVAAVASGYAHTVVLDGILVGPDSLAAGTAGVAYPAVTFTQSGGIGAIT